MPTPMQTPSLAISNGKASAPPGTRPSTSSSGNDAMASPSAFGQGDSQSHVFRGRHSSRTPSEVKSPISGPPLIPHRRSSILSFSSLDDTRHSAGDFIRPGLGFDEDGLEQRDEPSHWHSSPLAFAFLPALAGLFFTNGSAFVTDALLLCLAALFLNWSVRLPWDWYHSAQVVTYSPISRRSSATLETFDELDEDDLSSANGDKLEADGERKSKPAASNERDKDAADAASKLARHETFALALTFVMPACAAYLLHVIRSQLSRPSEGLVSDYNLTIFLLAAEIRPVRQLIRLITNRTLHLQRVVSAKSDSLSHGLGGAPEKSVENLSARLAALEARTNDLQPGMPTAQEDIASLSADMKRRYEPRLDALERAVRRYEKRATTLTLLTEQRLQSLESRLQDALSLAAVAAQSNNNPGLVAAVLSALSTCMMLPFEVMHFFLVWPITVAETVLSKAGEFVYGRPKQRPRKSDSTQARSRPGRKKDEAYSGRHY